MSSPDDTPLYRCVGGHNNKILYTQQGAIYELYMYTKMRTYETTIDTANYRTLFRMKIIPLQDDILNHRMRETTADKRECKICYHRNHPFRIHESTWDIIPLARLVDHKF